MRRAASGMLFALVSGAALLAHAGEAIPPARLRRDLEQGAKLFRQSPDLATANVYAERFSYVEVEWEGGSITVRDPWLEDAVAALERLSPEARRRQLDAIADHLAARAIQIETPVAAEPSASASPGATPEDPDRILQGILDQKRYQAPPEDPKLAQAAVRIRDRIRAAWKSVTEFLTELFTPREDAGTWQRIKNLFFMAMAVLVVGVIAWLVVRALLRAAVDTAVEEPETEMPEAPPQPAEMAAQAKQRAASGDHRGAIRALYLALLGRLHQQGAITYDKHRTNREYLRTMRAGTARRTAFAELVEVFDRKWYGKEECSREELEAFERTTLAAGDPAQDAGGKEHAA